MSVDEKLEAMEWVWRKGMSRIGKASYSDDGDRVKDIARVDNDTRNALVSHLGSVLGDSRFEDLIKEKAAYGIV